MRQNNPVEFFYIYSYGKTGNFKPPKKLFSQSIIQLEVNQEILIPLNETVKKFRKWN